jgi:hypothetical protein
VIAPRHSYLPAYGVFLALAIFGGSSRADSFVQIPAHIFAVIFGTWALLIGNARADYRTMPPLILIAALTAICLLQLVPLPPDLWNALPQNDRYAEFARIAEVAAFWRPLSVNPDATLSVLFGLIPPVAALLALGCLPSTENRVPVKLALGVIALGSLAGIIQLVSGGRESLYIVELSSSPVTGGFFANRNHFALLLALGLPSLAAYVVLKADRAQPTRSTKILSLLAALFATILALLIFATGSRSGLVLGCAALLGSGAILYPQRDHAHVTKKSLKARLPTLLIGLALVGLVAIVLAESLSLRRLFVNGTDSQTRSDILPIALLLVRKFFPLGAGMGTFVEVFQEVEPLHMLGTDYVNHAHNDYVEFLIEGGIFAVVVMIGAGWWWLAHAKAALGMFRQGSIRATVALFGTICSALIGIASLVDYPVRTPLFAALLMLFLFCMTSSVNDGRRNLNDDLRQ